MKKLVAMLLAGAMVFSMAACGSNGNNNASDGTKGTDSQKEEGNSEAASDGDVEAELGVYWWGSQTRAEQTQQILDMYAEEHPGITFNTMPGQWTDYWTKLSTDAAGQSIPDLVAMDYKYINQFVSNGSLLNLDPYVEDGTLNLDDVDEKIKCVKALASKAILAKTIRTIERHEMEIAKEQAVAQGVTVESILTAAKHKDSSRLMYIKTKVKQELLDSITKELTDNAHGYISEDFARVFAKNLISFVPLLMVLNPKTKMIWAGITLVTWMIVILIGYMVPNIVGGIMMMCLSSIICAFTSFALTKNWSYYSAVSMLKLTHRLKKVPSLTVEAVQSIRLILGSVVIGLLTILIVNGHFL